MERDFFLWMFINLMVALGLGVIASYPPLPKVAAVKGRFSWSHIVTTSVMAVFAMLFPWSVAPGVQIDLRTIPLGLAAWAHGWITAAVIGAVIVAVRYWIGGPGFMTALYHVVLTVLLTPLLFRRRERTAASLAAMGLLQAVGLYLAFLLTPNQTPPPLRPSSPWWLLIAGVYSVGPWLFSTAGQYTFRKRELERMVAAEFRSKEALLELVPYGILFLNQEWRVTRANEAAQLLMEQNQVPAAILAHPEIDHALREQSRISNCRVSYLCQSGQHCIVLVSAVPSGDGGAVVGLQNVTPVVAQEREEATRDHLEMLGRLAATAAHEIKNPLTTIKGFMQLLSGRPEFAAHRSAFTLVQGEAEHINRVITDFLELSGHTTPQPVVFGLDELIREVQAAISLQFPDSGVTATITGESGLELVADRRGFKQILKNLVANAYEAMPSGGRLEVRRERQGDAVVLTVTDTGPGIAEEMLPLIFTPYMTTKATGTGLGLAISHKLALDMGGRLEVASTSGQGCSFRLVLPQAPVAKAEAAAALMAE